MDFVTFFPNRLFKNTAAQREHAKMQTHFGMREEVITNQLQKMWDPNPTREQCARKKESFAVPRCRAQDV